MKKALALILLLLACGSALASSFVERPIPDVDLSALPATSAELRQLDVTVEGQKVWTRAWVPEGEGPFPLVILAHGLGTTHQSCLDYAQALSAHGVAACLLDFRGGGVGSLSQGRVADMSVDTEAADLEAVLDAARGWDFADPGRIVLMGFSQGGLVSSLVAAARREEVAGLVLCFPAFNLPEIFREGFRSVDNLPDSFDFGWVRVGRRYGVDMLACDPYGTLAAYDGPVLLLHGDKDQLVPIVYSYRAYKLYARPEFYIIRGAGHGFSGDAFDRAMACTWDFLDTQGLLR